MVADDEGNDHTSMGIRMAIYIELLTLITHMLVGVLSLLSITNDRQCRGIIPFHFFLFHLSGGILYLIFVRRIELIYDNTLFKLPHYHIFNIYAGIALYSMPYLLYVDWFVIETRFDPEFGCTLHPISVSSFLLAVALLLHTLIAIYALYLFVYPLHHLIQQQESFNNPRVSDKLYLVMIKYSILYSCSIASSLVLLVLSITSPVGYVWSLISSLTNGIVLILLHPIQNKLYKNCCCCVHALCVIAWGAPRDIGRKHTVSQRRERIVPPQLDHKRASSSMTHGTATGTTTGTTTPTPVPTQDLVTMPMSMPPRPNRSPQHQRPTVSVRSATTRDCDSSNLPHAASILSHSNQEHLTIRITSLKSPSNTHHSSSLKSSSFKSSSLKSSSLKSKSTSNVRGLHTVGSPPLSMVQEDQDLSHELYAELHGSNQSENCNKDECPLDLVMAAPPMFVRGPSTSLALECGLSPRSTVRATERIQSLSPRSPTARIQSPMAASERVFSMSINHDINSEIATQKQVYPMTSVVVEPSLPDVIESVEEEEVLPRSPTLHKQEAGVHNRTVALSHTVDVESLWNSTFRITPMQSSNEQQYGIMSSRRDDVRLMLSASTARSHLPEVGSFQSSKHTVHTMQSRSSAFFNSRSIAYPDRFSRSWQNVDAEVAESFQNSIIRTLRFLDSESSQL